MVRAISSALLLAFVACAQAQTPEERLFEAIEAGKPLVAEGIVLRTRVDLDARNSERETPLHLAIEKGFKELTELMLKAGAPVGARSANGGTPLHHAALHEDSWFVDLLLLAKAAPRARNDDGESVLQWAVMTGNARTARNLSLIHI